ncbi:response regulator [Aestuariicella sp. G3-2]|uniref:response regulator n=1 Tax=Pseudomaricurvus albidus TaxID=2842452 RepID=UPI001C0B47E6|nr:response regulator [Aestuariicella albida]MBU3070981.1 response regulator [Aestuariicella albida]
MSDIELNIVFVDDDLDDQYLLMQAIKEIKPRVQLSFFDSGFAFLDQLEVLIKAPEPILVLLDLNLPPMGGLDILKQLRSKAATRGLPVVIYSTSSSSRDIQEAYEQGANTFLVKPSRHSDAVTMMQTLCDYWINLAARYESKA